MASVQKVDGSSDPLLVEVYKDGSLVMQKSTIIPKGDVEIQTNLKPSPTPTKIPVPETTVNATVTMTAIH